MNIIKLNDINIKQDDLNRYCLNDLHKAAMKSGKVTKQQRPSSFLRNDSIKVFVQTLSDAQKRASVVITKGGANQGTYAHELVALRYAAWLNPEFEISVYKVFRDFMMQGFSVMNQINMNDLNFSKESSTVSKCASIMNKWGLGGRKKQLQQERARLIEQAQMYLPELTS